MEYILKSVSGQSGNTRIIWAHSTIILENKKNYWKQNVRRDPIYEKKMWPMQPYIRVTKAKPKPTFRNSMILQSKTIETHLFPCETCEFTSICREDMTAHANSRESYQFNCNLCGFVATSQENIDANIGAHHETEQLESFFMWPMRLWNNFPGQPTSAWMWRYQHSTQPFNTVLLWPMRLQVTSWIIWFVLDISYILIIWLQIFFRFVIFDYKFCLWCDYKLLLE